jgi:hypothetical protein
VNGVRVHAWVLRSTALRDVDVNAARQLEDGASGDPRGVWVSQETILYLPPLFYYLITLFHITFFHSFPSPLSHSPTFHVSTSYLK